MATDKKKAWLCSYRPNKLNQRSLEFKKKIVFSSEKRDLSEVESNEQVEQGEEWRAANFIKWALLHFLFGT